MKKYVKPELIFESFEMSQQIASCDYDLVDGTSTDAGCSFSGFNKDFNTSMTIFSSTNTCDIEAQSYCYHNSSGGFGIFNS